MTATLDHRADHLRPDAQDPCVGAVYNSSQGHSSLDAQTRLALGGTDSSDQTTSGTHRGIVAGPTPPAAMVGPSPSVHLPQEAPTSPPTSDVPITNAGMSAGTTTTTSGHPTDAAQSQIAAGGSNSEGGGHATDDDQRPVTASLGPILRDPLLALLADAVNDLEGVRIASDNRYRQLTRTEADDDGEVRGLGLSDDVAEVKRVRVVADSLAAVEHQAILNLQRQMRKHPLWIAWGKESKGVGEKQLARLLASIGDPYWNDLHGRPRTVSELWAYCGLHVVDRQAPKRTKGTKLNWSQDARMRAWNIAGACLKAQGHYADVYYAAREKYLEATHPAECLRCGPKGKPAIPGSPLSDGHKHARALRIVAKTVLMDLWLTSRELHATAADKDNA